MRCDLYLCDIVVYNVYKMCCCCHLHDQTILSFFTTMFDVNNVLYIQGVWYHYRLYGCKVTVLREFLSLNMYGLVFSKLLFNSAMCWTTPIRTPTSQTPQCSGTTYRVRLRGVLYNTESDSGGMLNYTLRSVRNHLMLYNTISVRGIYTSQLIFLINATLSFKTLAKSFQNVNKIFSFI